MGSEGSAQRGAGVDDRLDEERDERIGPIEFSAILPCYNEEAHIAKAVERLQHSLEGIRYEIIIVDDGSTDSTRSEALKIPNVSVISYKKNTGKGAAIVAGLKQAKGETVGHIDGDLDLDPSVIRAYIDALKSADIAIGSKSHPDSSVDSKLLQRRFLTWSFRTMTRVLVGLKFRDTQAGIKVIRKEAAHRMITLLRTKGYGFDVELLTVAQLLNLKIVELPVNVSLGRFRWAKVPPTILEVIQIACRFRILRTYQKQIRCASQSSCPSSTSVKLT
jgi:glycosyltransferase involved in cell wall biosynthesis